MNKRIELTEIIKIQFNESNAAYIRLVLKNGQDLTISTYKRSEFVLFLIETFYKLGLEMFQREILDQDVIEKIQLNKKVQQSVKIVDVGGIEDNIDGFLNEIADIHSPNKEQVDDKVDNQIL